MQNILIRIGASGAMRGRTSYAVRSMREMPCRWRSGALPLHYLLVKQAPEADEQTWPARAMSTEAAKKPYMLSNITDPPTNLTVCLDKL